jgi:chromosome partitioning protein
MYDIRTKMAREILAELRSHFSDRMFKTVVNFNTKIKEAASFGQPINEYDPASKGQQDFQNLAREVIGAEEQKQTKSKRLVDTLASQLDSIGASATELLRTAKIEPIGEAVEEPVPEPSVGPVEEPRVEPETTPEVAPSLEPAGVGESVGAEEGIAPTESAGAGLETRVETLAEAARATDKKLSDYYGVNQVQDAVVFVTLYPRATSVQLAGDFNNWQPDATPMERVGDSGVWQTKIKLPHGIYRYRLVVDGQWQQDPYNERTELNPFGELNSVVEID